MFSSPYRSNITFSFDGVSANLEGNHDYVSISRFFSHVLGSIDRLKGYSVDIKIIVRKAPSPLEIVKNPCSGIR
jgi:hypothetical protein